MGEPHIPALASAALTSADGQLVRGVLARKTRPLAKTITLLESRRRDHQVRAQVVLEALLPHTGNSIRLGISGVPGGGKSTFIEALGLHLIEKEHRLAVLAIDPSSSLTGGSILGDKTRMERLSQQSNAFIRPSPSAGTLGGVAEKTRETMLVCEAAGYDVIIVETVGVGQSETSVAGMVDAFALLQLPNAGDDLQAIKKGIVELADLVVINKADIDPKAAELARNQWQGAFSILRSASPHWKPSVLAISALQKEGILEFWSQIERYRDAMVKSGEFAQKRRQQALDWMWSLIDSGLWARFRHHSAVSKELPRLSEAVTRGGMTPVAAATRLLALMQS
jgi:LAO/AO transport system kinase